MCSHFWRESISWEQTESSVGLFRGAGERTEILDIDKVIWKTLEEARPRERKVFPKVFRIKLIQEQYLQFSAMLCNKWNVRKTRKMKLYIFLPIFIAELCHGRNYKSRLEFLDICENIMEFFSKSFFKEHFFDEVLLLGKVSVLLISSWFSMIFLQFY